MNYDCSLDGVSKKFRGHGHRRSERELTSPEFVREFITALALLPGAKTAANTDTFKLERRRP
jgi:hypothetical protein